MMRRRLIVAEEHVDGLVECPVGLGVAMVFQIVSRMIVDSSIASYLWNPHRWRPSRWY
jgi:hypothetical protein